MFETNGEEYIPIGPSTVTYKGDFWLSLVISKISNFKISYKSNPSISRVKVLFSKIVDSAPLFIIAFPLQTVLNQWNIQKTHQLTFRICCSKYLNNSIF